MISNNSDRQIHLLRERKLEIKRDGIPALFSSHHGICFQIQDSYLEILTEWMEQKFSVNVYEAQHYRQVLILDKSSIYLHGNLLIIQNKKAIQNLHHGAWYYIAKNNATISVLTRIFEQTHKVDPSINSFINDEQVTEIPTEQSFPFQDWFSHNLNQCQSQAVNNVVMNKISFIKGPPGCGKTKVISRLCSIFAYHNCKVLVGAVSNQANLSIMESIIKETYEVGFEPNIVLFIPKELSAENMMLAPEIRRFTFRQKIIQNYLAINQGDYYTAENLEYLLDQYWSNHTTSKTFISVLFQAIAKTFAEANIVISTCVSSTKLDNKLAQHQQFKPYIGILDEASQATWGDAYCFLCMAVSKMVFFGDDKQLSPTVISQNQVLKETMFTSLYAKNQNYYTLLNEQYRMHPEISAFPNQYFYEGQLKDATTKEERSSRNGFFQRHPISFIDCRSEENEEVDPNSGKKNYWNDGEVEIVMQVLSMFPQEEYQNIGIISPYDWQIRRISAAVGWDGFSMGITVKTCDGYQGGQKDYILFSCVRSNPECKIGFCGEETRINVSITRARKGLMVIGNMQTFANQSLDSQVWPSFIKHLGQRNKIFKPSQIFSESHSEVNEPEQNIQIDFIDQDSEEEQLLSLYREDKKKIKKILSKFRNEKMVKTLKEEIYKLVRHHDHDGNDHEGISVRVTKSQMSQFEQMCCKKKQNLQVGEGKAIIDWKVQQVIDEIEEMRDFNHLKEAGIVRRIIDIKCLSLLAMAHRIIL